MKHLLEILKDNGFKEYRVTLSTNKKTVLKDNGDIELIATYTNTYTQNNNIKDFSTMVAGGLTKHFVKDNDMSKEVIWGLREYKKPPNLLQPILDIEYDKSNGFLSQQDLTERLLKQVDHKEIYDNLFKNKKYKLKSISSN
jgi:hypothetical protein